MKREPRLVSKIALAMIVPWTSQKLWMTVIGLSVVISLFWTAVYYLYSFTESGHIVAFEAMFQTTAWTVSAIVLGYLGLQSALDGFKRSVVSTTSEVVQSIFKKEEVKIDQNITVTEKVDDRIVQKYADAYAADPSYRPPATVPDCEVGVFR